MAKSKPPICPVCGCKAKVTKFRQGVNGNPRQQVRNECCGLRSWGWGVPLETTDTLLARRQAHDMFDPIWKSGKVQRNEAYKLLSAKTRIPHKELHFKTLSKHDTVFCIFAAYDLRKFMGITGYGG